MIDMIKMVVVLTLLSAFSGGLLALVRDNTEDKIEKQVLICVKGPAIKSILEGASNDPLTDLFKIKDGDTERSFYVGKFNGKTEAVAFESTGKGYGGDIGLMIGVNIEDGSLRAVCVTTHSETPGMGAKAKTDPDFAAQFVGVSIAGQVSVASDGGSVNVISGATITSKAVCQAVSEAGKVYNRLKPQIEEKLKEFN